MEFLEVISRRRMVRNYTDDPVDRDTVERILDAGRKAPSAGFSQGHAFVVVTDGALWSEVKSGFAALNGVQALVAALLSTVRACQL